jgi:hypothetical protein
MMLMDHYNRVNIVMEKTLGKKNSRGDILKPFENQLLYPGNLHVITIRSRFRRKINNGNYFYITRL